MRTTIGILWQSSMLMKYELLQLSLPGENLGAVALAEVVSRDTDLPDTVGQGDQ